MTTPSSNTPNSDEPFTSATSPEEGHSNKLNDNKNLRKENPQPINNKEEKGSAEITASMPLTTVIHQNNINCNITQVAGNWAGNIQTNIPIPATYQKANKKINFLEKFAFIKGVINFFMNFFKG